MNVLSLFDGISCGRIALDRANINVNKYFASEIDNKAIEVSKHNFPDIIHLGDIKNIIPPHDIDLILAGSPCQGFSYAGKKLNFDDHRSKLFFEFIKILNIVKENNPNVYFILENVKMSRKSQDIITEILNVPPLEINSNIFSAQNRKRLYWTNIQNIKKPEDKNITLKDIILEFDDDKNENNEILIKHIPHGYLKEKCVYVRKYPTLCAQSPGSKHRIIQRNGSYRTLTPLECERLQTLPDDYTAILNKTARYKHIGNGWTVDVISYILSHINT